LTFFLEQNLEPPHEKPREASKAQEQQDENRKESSRFHQLKFGTLE
jgi:hypothetical protein